MKNDDGFTLIELVIVLLGILATTAAPKFIDLTSDARMASFRSLGAALKSAAEMSYMKQIVQGKGGNSSITINGHTINMVNGYPDNASIKKLIDYPLEQYSVTNDPFAEFHWKL